MLYVAGTSNPVLCEIYRGGRQVYLPHLFLPHSYQCRRHRFKPWSGKIPHALGQLSPGATGEATAVRSPSNAATERPLAETKAQHSQKQLTDFIFSKCFLCFLELLQGGQLWVPVTQSLLSAAPAAASTALEVQAGLDGRGWKAAGPPGATFRKHLSNICGMC